MAGVRILAGVENHNPDRNAAAPSFEGSRSASAVDLKFLS